MSQPARIITAEILSPERYAPYGQVLAAEIGAPSRSANFGRARRYDFLADMQNLRPENAKLNVCIFDCSAWLKDSLELKVLERHAYSTQVFMPMAPGRYVTIVAEAGDVPDVATARAFIIDDARGITYYPGTWHYPMTVLGEPLKLSCLVYENGSAGDCEVLTLPAPLVVQL